MPVAVTQLGLEATAQEQEQVLVAQPPQAVWRPVAMNQTLCCVGLEGSIAEYSLNSGVPRRELKADGLPVVIK